MTMTTRMTASTPSNEVDQLVEAAADAADKEAEELARPPAAVPEDALSLLNNWNGTATTSASNVARKDTSHEIAPQSHHLLPRGGRVATFCS
jgi:hypothetical protein